MNKFLYIVLILTAFGIQILFSQDNSTCLDCHSDPDITMDKNGKTISLAVKKFVLSKSVHAKMKCVDCHQGFNPDDIPHKENITPVNCTSCHKDFAKKHNFHPQMALSNGMGGSSDVNCKGCHGDHGVTSSKNPTSKTFFVNSTDFCGTCHKQQKEDHLLSEHHFQYEVHNRQVPNCINCHSYQITKGTKLERVQLKVNQEKMCLNCHLNNKNQSSQFAKSLINYEESAHGMAILRGNQKAAVCVDCHGVHKLQRASVPTSKINHYNIPDLCGKCHTELTDEYMKSIHGRSLKKGSKDSPNCTYCHSEHSIQSMPDVPHEVFTNNKMNFNTVANTKMIHCVKCHADNDMMSKYNLLTVDKAHEWLPSLEKHWETVRCIDCHSSYAPPNLSHNILNREQTVKQCENCHSKNSLLMTKLYIHEKQASRDKYGFLNGTLLSDAYVIGTTRNIYLDTLSGLLFAGVVFGVFGHGFLRWYSSKKRKQKVKNEN